MKTNRLIRVSGSTKWSELSHKDLVDVDVDFEMVSYNPIRRNPGMMAETLIQMLPFLSQNENVNVRRLTEEILTNLGLPSRILIPEEDILAAKEQAAQQQQAMIQAEQQAKLGGAAAGRPAIEAGQAQQVQQLMQTLPPEDAARLAEQLGTPIEGAEELMEDALPGGGGAPIRGEA